MNTKQVESFLKLQPQLKATYQEIGLLSKKKPTDTLNIFKLKLINDILSRANKILGDYCPFPKEFELFDEDSIPNNSDVVFLLSHYLTSLEKLRCDNITREMGNWYWLIDSKKSMKETERPEIK